MALQLWLEFLAFQQGSDRRTGSWSRQGQQSMAGPKSRDFVKTLGASSQQIVLEKTSEGPTLLLEPTLPKAGPALGVPSLRKRPIHPLQRKQRLHARVCFLAICSGQSSMDIPIKTHDVKEYRCRKYDRVQSVDKTAMPGDQMAPILDAPVTFDRRHHKPAEKSHDCNDQR